MTDLSTLCDLISGFAGKGEKPAVTALDRQGSHTLAYSEMHARVLSLAAGLTRAGLGRDHNAVFWAENSPDWITVCLAVIFAGASPTPLDPQTDDRTLAGIFKDCRPRLVFTTSDRAERIRETGGQDQRIIFLDRPDDPEHGLPESGGPAPEPPRVEPQDRAALFYTSGTTGPPKGVPLTHENLVWQINAILKADLVGENDRLLLPLPLHHVYPFAVGMLVPLALGLNLVLPYGLSGPEMVRAMTRGRVTVIIGVPRLYRAMYAGIESKVGSAGKIAELVFRGSLRLSIAARRRLKLNLGRFLFSRLHKNFAPELKITACGGAALDPDLGWKLMGLGWDPAIGYGLTETSPILTMTRPGDTHLDSVGSPITGVQIRIAQTAETPGASPGMGEIQARGPNVFAGYYNLPDKTAEAFTPDGWFRTGDLGRVDKHGYLYVAGRASTLIVAESGENIQPDAVEEAYREHPYVREAGVLEKDGSLAAVIVADLGEIRRREPGRDVEEVMRRAVSSVSAKLPSYRRLSDYVLVRRPLPRTRLGKIRRHLLPEIYEQAAREREGKPLRTGPLPVREMHEQDRALLSDPAAKKVWDLLAERYPRRPLTPDSSPQLDLGIDSLQWLNLTMELRTRAGVELTEQALARVETVRDLLQEAAGAGKSEGTGGQPDPLQHPEQYLSPEQKKWLTPLGPGMSVLARLIYGLLSLIMRTVFRLRVTGEENLPERGCIIAPNHVSYLDPFAVASALGFARLENVYWGSWRGAAFHNPLNRLISRLAKALPVDPHGAAVSSLALGAAVLRDGKSLVWFPEGRRSPTGELQDFKRGAGMLAARFGVPIVPVYVHGTGRAMPVGRILPRPARITVRFGPPVVPGETRCPKQAKPPEYVTRMLQECIAEMARQFKE